MTERPIGCVFKHPQRGMLKVVETEKDSCEGCALQPFMDDNYCLDDHTGFCNWSFRSDRKDVIFKKIGGKND